VSHRFLNFANLLFLTTVALTTVALTTVAFTASRHLRRRMGSNGNRMDPDEGWRASGRYPLHARWNEGWGEVPCTTGISAVSQR
jgi:hypothetical protein